ncbi:hypothetical protein [Acinetobacter vivianii]|uniref:hypothetical protein n=1 Tax=Acinetobacter vivianii TaxID=1776742 RepID=UPI002DBAD8EC|nr:hypothetical protein [Acinetobacter vivianii]MEB6481172.1 hypothetical protein [Acinetobacter vivianii]MEB6659534.1 hypothetical protein [Acinetobacter vivianii]
MKFLFNFIKLKQSDLIYHGVKTFEYDFSLHEDNRFVMIEVLKMLHPKIVIKVQGEVNEAVDNSNKARALFSGMFECSKI